MRSEECVGNAPAASGAPASTSEAGKAGKVMASELLLPSCQRSLQHWRCPTLERLPLMSLGTWFRCQYTSYTTKLLFWGVKERRPVCTCVCSCVRECVRDCTYLFACCKNIFLFD